MSNELTTVLSWPMVRSVECYTIVFLLVFAETMATALNLIDSLITSIDKDNSDTVTVTYWAGRGLCEPIRLLLAGIGIKFENIFIQSKEQFDALKASSKLAYGQLPLVEMDGMNLVMSGSTFRFIANRYQFMGANLRESYLIDLICEGCKDARSTGKLVSFPWSMDTQLVLESFKFERYCKKWEEILNESKNCDGYFVESGQSAADIAVFEVLEFLEIIIGKKEFCERMKAFPKLMKNYALTRNLGDIQLYIDESRNHLEWTEYAQLVSKTLGR